ncbi:hypothetical protein GF312_17695 [Candidatus Poribacteria bacterium]|nr:hypothetical protein [Candidatus Poribacteria bacterium]
MPIAFFEKCLIIICLLLIFSTSILAQETLEEILESQGQIPTYEQKPEPLVLFGMPDETPPRISAEDILSAIVSERDINIENALIEGDLDIVMSAGELNLDEKGNFIIYSDVVIRSCDIEGYTLFSSTNFAGESSFDSTRFKGDADFLGAVFNNYAAFSAVSFHGYADFTGARFYDNAHFISAKFHGDADFKFSVFDKEAFFTSAVFRKNADFSNSTMSRFTDFMDTTFTLGLYFRRASLELPANFEGVNYHENTVISGFWNDVICNIISFITRDKLNLPRRTVTDFYQLDTGIILDSSTNPYLKRYINDEQWIRSWRKSIWWRELLFILWEASSHCGRSIELWAGWSAIIAFIFGIIYWRFFPDKIAYSVGDLSEDRLCFRSYMYYSVVTLTTLGYGDIVPLTNKARLVVGIEVICGYVMLGGLVSIFATKFATRS